MNEKLVKTTIVQHLQADENGSVKIDPTLMNHLLEYASKNAGNGVEMHVVVKENTAQS